MYVGVFILGVIGVVVIGGIVAMVALLANPKTRAAGVVLLLIGLLVVVVGGLLMVGVWFTRRAAHVTEHAEVMRAEAIQAEAEQRRIMDEFERRRLEARDGETAIRVFRMDEANEAPAPATQPSDTATGSDAATEAVETPGAEEPAGATSPGTEEPAEEATDNADTESGEEPPPPAEPAEGTDASTEAEETPAAEERPEWMDKLPEVAGTVYQVRIKTDPLPNLSECERQLPDAVNKAVVAYAESQLNRSSDVARRVQLTPQYIEENIIQQRWPEPVEISLGKWVQLHALLQFDKEAQGLITKQCEQAQQRLEEQRAEGAVFRRLCYSGTGLAAILALLAVLFACLKVDHATAGACRGRLCLAASAAIATVAAAAWCAVMLVQEPTVVGEVVAPTAVSIESAVYQATATEGSGEAVVEVARDTARLKLLVVVGVAVGGILALLAVIGLLANPKTRVAGLAVLVLGLLLPLGVVFVKLGFDVSLGPVELLVVVGASVYVILLTVLSRQQWAWVLGMIACFVIAAFFTPADPLSMLLVVVPLCVLYTIAVLAWKAPRREAGGEIPPRERADAPAGHP